MQSSCLNFAGARQACISSGLVILRIPAAFSERIFRSSPSNIALKGYCSEKAEEVKLDRDNANQSWISDLCWQHLSDCVYYHRRVPCSAEFIMV